MTKIVYNACYGGFSLSHKAIMRYAELKGITLYAENHGCWNQYYTVPVEEYNEVHTRDKKTGNYTESNALYFSYLKIARTDPALVQVVEELGEEANGDCADLQIVDIPKGTLYRIRKYNGNESVMTQEDHEWSIA